MLFHLGVVAGAVQARHILENARLRIEIEPKDGVVSRIRDKRGEIDLVAVDGLADVFRLVVRDAEAKKHIILGKDQRLSSVTQVESGLNLAWVDPLVDTGGVAHHIRVRMEVRMADESLEFKLFVDNSTPGVVTEVCYPCVGGLRGLGRDRDGDATFVMLPTTAPTIKKLASPFEETRLSYPSVMNMSYSSVYNTKTNRSLYFAAHDTIGRFKYYSFKEESTPAGKDVLASVQFTPFVAAGKKFAGPPVVLRFHDGSWNDAGAIYREWFVKTFGIVSPSQSWIRRQSFVQDLMLMLPEGTINLKFNDIPSWAKDAHDHGIDAVLISGWNRGGHDNGYPYYEPDPLLGTYDDLRRGIEACHRMGMRVYFFANYQPAMIDSDWFKKELHQYVALREDGSYDSGGFGMGTLWARMGHPKKMASLDPSFPAYREVLLRQFLKLVEIGADGLHIDKMWPGFDFNPRCELSPDVAGCEGAIQLSRQIAEKSRKINPDFAMSFECNWDRMLEFGNAIWWSGNMSLTRSVFPEMIETRGITSPYDYLGVNNAVRYSQVALLGPLNYCRSIGWEPWKGLARYIREVKRIQDSLSDAVFFGRALDSAQIQFKDEPAPPIEYNVYQSLKSNKRVCIMTNSGSEEQNQVIRAFTGHAGGRVRIHAPFCEAREATLPVTVPLPAERIVFIEELPAVPDADDQALSQRPITSPQAPVVIRPSAPTSSVANGSFDTGDFTGWEADPNWCVDRNTCGEYRGWDGKTFAWSGGKGEAATGRLKSLPFVLDQEGVRLLVAGWHADPRSPGANGNYVALKTIDNVEIDRRGAPDSLSFVPVLLDGSGYKGQRVFLEAVDDANGDAYSMFCIDDVRTVPLPPDQTKSLEPPTRLGKNASITLENEFYLVEVSRDHGVVSRIRDKTANLELIREPRLADNFKFTLPIPGKEPWQTREANYVLGREQTLSSHDISEHTLNLRWAGPLKSREGEKHDVAVTMRIELVGKSIQFNLQIKNQTPNSIGEVFFPIVGGLTGIGDYYRDLKATQLMRKTAAGMKSADVFYLFSNLNELGDQGPEQYYSYPGELSEPWVELVNKRLRRAVYIGSHDRANRSQVLHLELLPGIAGTPRWDGNWPRRQELDGLPAGVLLSFVDFANHPPGERYDAAPVVLQSHGGDLESGEIYRSWKSGH